MKPITLSILVAAVLGASISSTATAAKVLLDNFTGDRYVDTSVWAPTSPGWGWGVQEVNRQIRRGAVNLKIRATSVVNAPDTYPVPGDQFRRRNRMLLVPDNLEGMYGMESIIKVNAAQVRGCPIEGSGETERTTSYSYAAMESIAYNDGRSTGDGDYTGEVFIQFRLEKSDTSSAPANQMDIVARVSRSGDADAELVDFVVRKRLTRARIGDRVRMTYYWNYTSQQITFRAVNLRTKKAHVWRYRPSPRLTTAVPAQNPRFFGNIQARSDLPRCRPESGRVTRPMSMIDADFDNVFFFKRVTTPTTSEPPPVPTATTIPPNAFFNNRVRVLRVNEPVSIPLAQPGQTLEGGYTIGPITEWRDINLPPGFTLDAANQRITGTPSSRGLLEDVEIRAYYNNFFVPGGGREYWFVISDVEACPCSGAISAIRPTAATPHSPSFDFTDGSAINYGRCEIAANATISAGQIIKRVRYSVDAPHTCVASAAIPRTDVTETNLSVEQVVGCMDLIQSHARQMFDAGKTMRLRPPGNNNALLRDVNQRSELLCYR